MGVVMSVLMRARARLFAGVVGFVIVAAGVAVGSGAPVQAAPVIGGQLFSGGECAIKITVLQADATLMSNLLVFLDDGTLFHDPGVRNIDVGQVRTFTGPEAGEELVFAIRVTQGGVTRIYKMGPGSRNPDNVVHAAVNDNGDGTFTVGFEDAFGGGDRDYNDNRFLFEGCVEPIVAVDDAAATNEDTPILIDVLANDGGVGIEVVSVGTPANGSAAINAGGGVTYTPNPDFNGTDAFTYTIEDDSGAQATATVTVTVAGVNDPPVCTAATPSKSLLWPPNHRRVPITVSGVTDVDGDPITITITSIFQDEPTNKRGDGNTAIDGFIGTGTASIRAERAGNGDGRVYHIGFTATDGAGGACNRTVLVGVPHDNHGAAPVNGGPLYNSTVSTP
jgi:hypothetical protein